ncbi:hypothetical protein SAMN04488038_111117 [Solimonas aquatica]|uniref:Collagen, middle region n=1 Tax=Solimonas aquatica TaxID=489703 RepID=A0A1H9JDE2_9GAMM|nr:hypothetical protein [Solimonas aquatica]SEQ84934.1 hypothetical protein SAMN04488038_111117 [Solimonas aquatica]
MFKKLSLATAVALSVSLAACGGGGGGSSSGSGSGGGNTTPSSASITGPLDTVQTDVSNTVIAPLVDATSGTALEGVLLCANSIVTYNALDIADAFANGLANPTTLTSTTPAQAQAALSALVSHLVGLLNSLAATSANTACSGTATGSTTVPSNNPLTGTSLAALGTQLLPVLTSAQQQLGGSSTLSATQLASILASISTAMNTAMTSISGATAGAPVLNGVLLAVKDSLAQLSTIATHAASGANGVVLAGDLQNLAETLLNDLLTQVLPVADLQSLAGSGASTDVLAQLQAAVATLTATLGTNPTTALGSNPLGGVGFASLTSLLDTLVPELTSSFSGVSGASSPLTLATTLVQTALASLLSLSGSGSNTSSGAGCSLSLLGLCLLPG